MKDLFPSLADILDRCDLVDQEVSIEPGDVEQTKGVREDYVGELPEHLRNLFIARSMMVQEIDELEAMNSDDVFVMQDAARKRSLLEIMDRLFWHEIAEYFNLWEHEGKVLAVRSGWKVVIFDDRRAKDESVINRRKNGIDLPLLPNWRFVIVGNGRMPN